MPALETILPQMVPEDKLIFSERNQQQHSSNGISRVAMVSGALLALASLETIFFIDVITASIAIFILLVFINISVHEKALEKQTNDYFTDLKEGLSISKIMNLLRNFLSFTPSSLF